jgi:hypothetical protein
MISRIGSAPTHTSTVTTTVKAMLLRRVWSMAEA